MYEVEINYDDFELDRGNIDPKKMENVLIWGADWTVGTIFEQVMKNKIDLNPKMQRRDVWKDDKKSRLIESIILNVPIPQIILAEDKNKKGSYMVIDGKQRLLSIVRFLSSTLKNSSFDHFKLSDLTILNELNGLFANDLPSEVLDVLLTQTIRTIVIKNWEDESILFTIFNRLNTGTVQLSPQELRMSLFPGEFIYYVNEHSLTPQIKRMLRLETPDSRMNDVEMIIRALSYRYFFRRYNGNFQIFLDETVNKLNCQWEIDNENIIKNLDNLMEDIDMIYDIFEEDSFHNYIFKENKYVNRFNKTAYDMLTYFISFDEIKRLVKEDKHKFKNSYEQSFKDEKFSEEFRYRTTEIGRVKYRFEIFQKTIEEVFNQKLDIDIANGMKKS